MDQLTVIVEDKVGLLAEISFILGRSRINIESLSVVALDGRAIITFLVKDEKKAAKLLRGHGYNVLESEILLLRIPDRPGELSKMSSLLAEKNISILNLYFIAKDKGHSVVAMKVDNTPKARIALGQKYLSID